MPDEGQVELVSSALDRAPGDPGAIPEVVAAMHRFAGGVYGALPSKDNLVLSPYSIAVALGMALTGAAGPTAEEMRTVLGADERFHAGVNALTRHVEDLAQRGIAIDPANQIFGQRGVAWEERFLALLAEEYGAGLRVVDYQAAAEDARALINRWVGEQTRDKIPDLLPPGFVDQMTRLVLVNALYLKAPWQTPFEESMTAVGPFRRADGSTVEVDLMSSADLPGAVAEGEGWRAARLPYVGGRLAMTVVLPDEGRLPDVERAVIGGEVPAMLARGRGAALDLRLPRWTFRTKAPLSGVLAALGMPTAFDPDAADFTPMTEDDLRLYLSAVVHEGFVAVDEKGTEAAAATAVGMRTTSAPVPVEFHVDRPFLFVIHDVEHGTPLFLGRVLDPTG